MKKVYDESELGYILDLLIISHQLSVFISYKMWVQRVECLFMTLLP